MKHDRSSPPYTPLSHTHTHLATILLQSFDSKPKTEYSKILLEL